MIGMTQPVLAPMRSNFEKGHTHTSSMKRYSAIDGEGKWHEVLLHGALLH